MTNSEARKRAQAAASQVQGAAEVGADVEALVDLFITHRPEWWPESRRNVAWHEHIREVLAGWVPPERVAEDEPSNIGARSMRSLYERAITWETTCLSCSKVLDSCYAETVRAEKAETGLERLREGVKALAEEWSVEDSSEWHYVHQPDVGRAIEAVKGALVPELRGLLDEDGGA